MPNHRFDLAAFAAAIDFVRQKRGLTSRELARAAGVSASTLTRLSQGRSVSLDGMASLAVWGELDVTIFIKDGQGLSRDAWLQQCVADADNWRALVSALRKLR